MKTLPGRLGTILRMKQVYSLRKIEFVTNDGKTSLIGDKNKFCHTAISRVLQGKRNTKRYIELLEKIFEMPIEQVRQWYKEDINKGRMELEERRLFCMEFMRSRHWNS